jgi:1-acyl-sn-glycerol-3-phosphate acyltransferase
MSAAPPRGPLELSARPVVLRGSAIARGLLALAGWRIKFDGLPGRQGVLIVYPHTSNWDLLVGLLAKWAIGIEVHFWGKHTLFAIPLFGRWLRWVGGVPVNRKHPHGVVGQMAERIAASRERDRFFWLALAPEGTREYREHWRSGFYQVALQAAVPLGLAYFDFAERVIGVEHFLVLSGDAAADMAAIEARLAHRRGRHPHLAAPVRLP